MSSILSIPGKSMPVTCILGSFCCLSYFQFIKRKQEKFSSKVFNVSPFSLGKRDYLSIDAWDWGGAYNQSRGQTSGAAHGGDFLTMPLLGSIKRVVIHAESRYLPL